MLAQVAKLTTPDEFLKLAFAWGYLQKTRNKLAAQAVHMTINDDVYDRLAKAYHAFIAATGQAGHHEYAKFARFDGPRLARRLYNLDHAGLVRFIYNEFSRQAKADRLVLNLTPDQASDMLQSYDPEILGQSLRDVAELL